MSESPTPVDTKMTPEHADTLHYARHCSYPFLDAEKQHFVEIAALVRSLVEGETVAVPLAEIERLSTCLSELATYAETVAFTAPPIPNSARNIRDHYPDRWLSSQIQETPE